MNATSSKTILIIQTAFIGDTILASQFARAVKDQFPDSKIHFFLRKGNESVIQGLSSIEKVWVWDKQGGKTRNLFRLISELRNIKFDFVFNLHRHFNSGLVTMLMNSKRKIGFSQNPLSMFYSYKVDHKIPHHPHDSKAVTWHEVQRNLQLLRVVAPELVISDDQKNYRPELPIQQKHRDKVRALQQGPYFVMAPASVWFTKAWSESKYRELTTELAKTGKVYFIGAGPDKDLCDRIREGIPNTENLCGQLNLIDSAVLMEKAQRVFVNDSAPLHLASCVNAKTTAIFCSTVPAFGYTPLAEDSLVIDTGNKLECRPCGLHGHKACPLTHFKCSLDVDVRDVLATVKLAVLFALISPDAFALVDKTKLTPPTPPEEIIEHTKEKSKLRTVDLGVEVVLNHREPVQLLDGRVMEVTYFSHKNVSEGQTRRASAGLKITGGDPSPEILVLNQDVNADGKETLYGAETTGYDIKMVKIVYDESITVIISSK